MPVGTSTRESASKSAVDPRPRRLYFDDAWAWSREQARALRRRDFGAVDWDNGIEEIEDVGNRHTDAWTSLCRNVISHLLKIEHGAAVDAVDHWRKEVVAWRREMHDEFADNPGMKVELSEMLAKAWARGRADAVQVLAEQDGPENWAEEKRIRRNWQLGLPRECPYSVEEIAGYDPFDKRGEPEPDVWPGPVARRLNEKLGRGYPVRHRVADQEGGSSR